MQNESDPEKTSRVEAEDAALDFQMNAEQSAESTTSQRQQAERSQKIEASQLPPANLALLISMFSTQAMSALGLFPNPITGKVDVQLALAKHYIDLLAVLEQKTAGNLTPEEYQLLTNTLHELRVVYVQQSKVAV